MGPLFQGTVYLADLKFQSDGTPFSVTPNDLAVVLRYLQLAAAPVARYAGQYGPNQWKVASQLPSFAPSVPGGRYSDRDVQNWVGQIVRNSSLPSSSAVFILNPPGLVNTDAQEQGGVGVLGYHGIAAVPYAFVNLLGAGFAVDDTADRYAEAVSHELAELVVDPRADGSNPEVCDGCGTNCLGASAYRFFFDPNGRYLAASRQFPPGLPYAFFLSAIARPAVATACPAPESGCAYPPP